MPVVLHHVFLDESGGVAISAKSELYLIVAALITRRPRPVELVIKRALKRFGTSVASGEIKAAHSSDKALRWTLEAIARQEAHVIAVVLDKRGIIRPPKDPEDLYRQAMARAIRLCAERWLRLDVTVDKRYTHKHLRQQLEWRIRENLADITGQAVVIRQVDSMEVKELQAVDHVAWAFWRKYQWGDDSYYQIIKERVLVEEIITAK